MRLFLDYACMLSLLHARFFVYDAVIILLSPGLRHI